MAPSPLLPLCFNFLLLSPLFFFTSISLTEAGSVGVNWGRVANNLPSASKVVKLLESQGIHQVKLYDTDPAVLRSLAGTGIKVVVALPNEQLVYVATRPSFAYSWVQKNVAVYYPDTQIQAISVGNEVFVDPHNLTNFLVPAMQNVHAALVRLHLDGPIKVSSPIALTALSNSYPSSSGSFRPDLADTVMKPMLDLLRRTGSYLMINVYPFFAYAANSDVISLDYALFRPNQGVVDPNNGIRYYNLFDAQMDAVFAAMRAVGYGDVKVVVSETGWPSKGDKDETGAGEENAAAYNGNLVRRVLSGNDGTPLMPEAEIDIYLFALFNENQKEGPTSERNYGLFYPTEQKVYDFDFQFGGGEDNPKRKQKEQEEEKGVAPASGGEKKKTATWCVANREAGKEKLQAALDYACGEGGADCREIQPGAACYSPNTVEVHASFAFNSYYQKMGRRVGTCDFQGAAYVVTQPPQYGKCEFPAN